MLFYFISFFEMRLEQSANLWRLCNPVAVLDLTIWLVPLFFVEAAVPPTDRTTDPVTGAQQCLKFNLSLAAF